MKTKITLILILFFQLNILLAQESKKPKDLNRNKGYFNITRLGVIAVTDPETETFSPTNGTVVTDLPTNNSIGYSLQIINGYFINPYFSVGIGIGLDGYKNPNVNTLPIFLDLRGYFSDNLASSYIFSDIGRLAKIENGTNNGTTFNLGLGYKTPLNKKSRFTIVTDISYSYKTISLDRMPIRDSDNRLLIKGFLISLGVIF